VALATYPPRGCRGWGPFVAHSRWNVELFDYFGKRGGETVVGLLIETKAAIDNLRASAAEGIDYT
jgi:4-hydroxy-2-oxoheptanedioate aldolase